MIFRIVTYIFISGLNLTDEFIVVSNNSRFTAYPMKVLPL